jgi:hypothetical protein
MLSTLCTNLWILFPAGQVWDGNNVQTADNGIPSRLVRPNHHISWGPGHNGELESKCTIWREILLETSQSQVMTTTRGEMRQELAFSGHRDHKSPVWSVLKKMVPLICCYMHTSDFYLQLLSFSVTNLWDLSGMCSLAPPWYSIMQLTCMSISQMTAKHVTFSEFHSHANWDIATSWWSLQQLGEMHGYLRGWGSDIWTSEEVILSSLLESHHFLTAKHCWDITIFRSSPLLATKICFVVCSLVFKE